MINSKKIANFLIEQGFPAGKKRLTKLKILKNFFKNNKLLTACLRGIFDTDGGLFFHPHTKTMIEISSKNQTLLTSLQSAFEKIKLKSGRSHDRLQLYGRYKMKQFFSVIGSSNPRNIIKYTQFLNKGSVPYTSETQKLLKHRLRVSIPYHGPVV